MNTTPLCLARRAATMARNGQTDSRRFDDCFEMGNGDDVVIEIVKDPALLACFSRKQQEIFVEFYEEHQQKQPKQLELI